MLAQLLGETESLNDDALVKLSAADTTVKASISALEKEWQVEMFPNFLKSCFMHKVSWEIMKLKYQKKVLASLSSTGRPKFVISFTGRYITHKHILYVYAQHNVSFVLFVALSLPGMTLTSMHRLQW